VTGALEGMVIVETAERVCGEYCGKLLADFGAEVIKVERPGGAPTRHMSPVVDGSSTVFGFFNTNKKSVVLDLTDGEDRARLDLLLARAQGLIDDHPEQTAAELRLDQTHIALAHPHLVHCAISPFGQGAPAEWQRSRPLNVINAGGWAYHSPSETPPGKPPLKGAGRFLSDYEAGIDAGIAMLASLHRQRRTGQGQFVDISEVEVQVNRIDCVLDRMLAGEIEPSRERTAYDMGGPGTSFACRDGHIYIFMTTKAHWTALCELMGKPSWTGDFPEDWLEFHCTPDRVGAFRRHFADWIAHQDKLPITEAAQQAGVAMVPVNTAADLPENPQLRHRGFFQELEGRVYPTVPYRMSATPVSLARTAPKLGEHGQEAFDAPA
jgi:crotonobetainyl-CoA:carnitine CoA-transferase CaiB-like acyl-CoA transferase